MLNEEKEMIIEDARKELVKLVNLRIDKTKGKIEFDSVIVGTKQLHTLLTAYETLKDEDFSKKLSIDELVIELEELKEKNKELYEIKYIASRFINRSMKQFSIGEFKYKVNNFIEWEDKIKAKIEERRKVLTDTNVIIIDVLQSFLEKE